MRGATAVILVSVQNLVTIYKLNKFLNNSKSTPGHYCVDAYSYLCEPGYYQDEFHGAECKPCPEGQYNLRLGMTQVCL